MIDIKALIHSRENFRLEVKKASDRLPGLHISNPGLFRPRIEEAWAGGISDPRNPIIFKMFTMIDVGERIGSGLYSIHSIWQNMEWPQPEFYEEYVPERTMLSIEFEQEDTLNVVENTGDVVENRNRLIIRLIHSDNKISASQIAKEIQTTERTAQRILERLKEKGLIERIGPDKGGYWKIINDSESNL